MAKYEFTDNGQVPDANGRGCWYPIKIPVRYTGKKFIADVLASGGHTFSVYAVGYQAMKGRPLSPTLPSSAVRASSGYQNSDYLVM